MTGYAPKLLVGLLCLPLVVMAALPQTATIRALVSGPRGDLYAAGALDNGGFVAQIPDGFLYRSASPIDAITAAADGSVFATGSGLGEDSSLHVFVLKLDSSGQLRFSRTIAGPPSLAKSIAVNSAGEALVSGRFLLPGSASTFSTTPDAVSPKSTSPLYGFLLKIDTAGQNTLVAILGYGGGPVAFDLAGNIYATFQVDSQIDILPTPGAFQTTHPAQFCGGTGPTGIPCGSEYVVKIDPDGTKLLYSTYLTGQLGATPSAIVVDAAGDAVIAGTTLSHDFPVTPNAFQKVNNASFVSVPASLPAATAGVISKLNPNGTALLWSTYFGGSGLETIADAKLDSLGNVLFTGWTASPDLPGASSPPHQCLTLSNPQNPYAARLSADGSMLLGSDYLFTTDRTAPSIAASRDGSAVVEAGNILTQLDFSGSLLSACLTDSADFAIIDRVAPNQLLTLFTAGGATAQSVSFNGIPSDVLYSGPDQINLRVPADAREQLAEVLTAEVSGSHIIRAVQVLPEAPSAFLSEGSCGTLALARNDDGSFNSCRNPANYGSVVSFYLNGVGSGNPVIALRDPDTGIVVSAAQDPDSPQGVWRVRVQVTPAVKTIPSSFQFNAPYEFVVNGTPVRDGKIMIFTRGALPPVF